ncbi:hypothetical protein [Bosea robiniae]|uniref:Uncharacterized protein n=1 Tax=Bosea robiniae TaxID=1036780 RepID=A0ABY0P9Z7_9HYPH|nr:hypothetical protein [Bosea robiniae]SDH79721.1 hypothetical protein SAMN05421844_11623 [Bosea robiniae]
MKPTVEAYTVALPWYEREDYQRLWELADDRDEMPGDYEAWHAAALSVINAWLARGRALQIVTIRPDEYLAWLEMEGLTNTAQTRLKYVECKASGAGSETGGLGVAADPESLSGSKS